MSSASMPDKAVTTWSASAAPAKLSYALSQNIYGPPPTDTQAEKLNFDLVRLLRIFLKHRYVIGGVIALALGIGLIFSLTATPLYMATATIETSSATVQVTSDQSLQPQSGGDSREIATFVELIGSRSLAERVVNNLKLADDPTFVESAGGRSLIRRVSRLLFGGGETDNSAQSIEARQRAAIGRVLGNTTASVVKTSRLLVISYSDADPKRAARIANQIAKDFIRSKLDRSYEATAYARDFLQSQLEQIRLKLQDSEKKVVDYADKEKLVSLDNKQTLLSAQLEDLNSALGKASIDRSAAEQLWLQVKDAKEFSSVPSAGAGGSVSIIGQLLATKSELTADYQAKRLIYKPGFPTMIALQARINDVDAQIAQEMEKAKTAIRSSYELAVQREQALKADLASTQEALIDARNRGVEYTMLQREADTNRSLYDGLLQRFKELSTVGGVSTNDLAIVDSAAVPGNPYSPRTALNLVLALVGGLMLGFAVAMGLEYFDNTIKTPDQMEALLGIPVLGLIPILAKDQTIQVALQDPHSALSEAYRSARTALQFSTDQGVPKNFVVTSARPGEGKTTTSTTLARMFGQIGMKVLVVDADLRNPSLHKVLGIDNVTGLSNYLTGGAEASEVLLEVDIPNMTVISSGPIPPNPAELLSSPKILTLLSELREQFDLIIIDSAPVMGLADALLLSSVADGTLIVCAAGETPVETIKAATKRITMTNGQLLGGILTKFNAQKAGYGYAYYGYDYYGYGKDNQKALPSA